MKNGRLAAALTCFLAAGLTALVGWARATDGGLDYVQIVLLSGLFIALAWSGLRRLVITDNEDRV